tara:strand:+ start:2834 stop:3793 length:960 start_codon:yes stop_codon:yes gene_type:complete
MKNKSLFLVFLLLVLSLFSLYIGSTGYGWFSIESEILWQIRLPRLLAAASVGASLGLAGALLQILLQNPLAEPYTLGISGGASIGLCIAMLFPLQPLWISAPIFSGIGCIFSTMIVFYLANLLGRFNQKSLLLSGILISFLASSLTYVFFSILNPYDLQSAISWLIGSFGHERDLWWPMQSLCFFALLLFSLKNSKKIDLFLLGEEISFSFLNQQKYFRLILLLGVGILTSISVSICGMIAFLGLISPHISMMYLKSMRAKQLLLASSLIGANLLVFSDLLTKLFYSWFYLPSGIFVALLGAPFMIYFLIQESTYAYVD